MSRISLGRYGFSIDVTPDDSHLAAASTIEDLGFGTLWINGGALDRLDRLTDLLRRTDSAMVGSSIIPPDEHDPADVIELYTSAEVTAPGRLIVGLGSSHRDDALGRLARYVDDLAPVPKERMLLAAFGPRALGLARDRFAGAMPMLFTPERTAVARQIIGEDRTLSVGLYVVLDRDAVRARSTARRPLGFLTSMAGYQKSLRRQGFSPEDIADVSDHLVDRLVARGDPAEVIRHAERLHTAGADHVHVTVLGENGQPTGLAAAEMLAGHIG